MPPKHILIPLKVTVGALSTQLNSLRSKCPYLRSNALKSLDLSCYTVHLDTWGEDTRSNAINEIFVKLIAKRIARIIVLMQVKEISDNSPIGSLLPRPETGHHNCDRSQ